MTKASDSEAPGTERVVSDGDFSRDEKTDLMSPMDVMAMEAVGERHDTGNPHKADFRLGGAVPRNEPTGGTGRYRSKDVYLRLENQVYGPFTQEELDELLASGDLTGFESASNDLRTWTPLIYHPRMTLRGQIDPDATHHVLHQRSDLPTASQNAGGVDLEALADMDEDAEPELPKMPLAAILIKPMKVTRSKGAVLEERVFANLDEESLEEVIERHGIPEAPPIPDDARRADKLEDTDELQMFVDETRMQANRDAGAASNVDTLERPRAADEDAGPEDDEELEPTTLFFAPQDLPAPPELPLAGAGTPKDRSMEATPAVAYQAVDPPAPEAPAAEATPAEAAWPGQEDRERHEEARIEQELLESGLITLPDERSAPAERETNENTKQFFTSELKAVDRETPEDDSKSVGPSRLMIGLSAAIVIVALGAGAWLMMYLSGRIGG